MFCLKIIIILESVYNNLWLCIPLWNLYSRAKLLQVRLLATPVIQFLTFKLSRSFSLPFRHLSACSVNLYPSILLTFLESFVRYKRPVYLILCYLNNFIICYGAIRWFILVSSMSHPFITQIHITFLTNM